GADLRAIAARDEDPLVGRVFAGRYRIEEWIGIGATGKVYRARPLGLPLASAQMERVREVFYGPNPEVAVKILNPEDAADPVMARRFHQEARAMSRLCHPNNLVIYDFGESESGQL